MIDSFDFEAVDVDHVVANRDFRDYTRPYDSTLFGALHLYADGEITHSNYLPARFDLVDTARAQYELVEAVERDGEYRDVPFCCVCSTRGCAYVRWDVTEARSDNLRIHMETLVGDPIGDSPYSVSREALYAAVHDLCNTVVEFCESNGIERFGWAERKEVPVAGREQYATLSELRGYREELQDLVES